MVWGEKKETDMASVRRDDLVHRAEFPLAKHTALGRRDKGVLGNATLEELIGRLG